MDLLEINMICYKYNINDFEIVDGLVNVTGNVQLANKELTELPLNFGVVNGSFYCYGNQLTTLVGSPTKVKGHFYAYYNQLTSLEGCPKDVRDRIDLTNNFIYDITGITKLKHYDMGLNVNPIFPLIKNMLKDPIELENLIECDMIREHTYNGKAKLIVCLYEEYKQTTDVDLDDYEVFKWFELIG